MPSSLQTYKIQKNTEAFTGYRVHAFHSEPPGNLSYYQLGFLKLRCVGQNLKIRQNTDLSEYLGGWIISKSFTFFVFKAEYRGTHLNLGELHRIPVFWVKTWQLPFAFSLYRLCSVC